MGVVYIGSDHGGFKLKQFLMANAKSLGLALVDIGPYSYEADDDYPDYAEKLCKRVVGEGGKGILICRSGHGMAIAANKFRGVYAAVGWNEKSARAGKVDDNVNVLCLPADYIKDDDAVAIIKAWAGARFSDEIRYARRLEKVRKLERSL